jgi:hypothetical protein
MGWVFMIIACTNVFFNVMFLIADNVYKGYNGVGRIKVDRKRAAVINKRIANLHLMKAMNKNPNQLKYVSDELEHISRIKTIKE